MTPAPAAAALAGLAMLATGVLAACGSQAAGQAAPSAPPVRLSLATSADYPGGSWAVLEMGGSAADHNNFWQVFVRKGRAATWKLATPPGVASNGGITVAAEGGRPWPRRSGPARTCPSPRWRAAVTTGRNGSSPACWTPGSRDTRTRWRTRPAAA